jgi:hypothetical protein
MSYDNLRYLEALDAEMLVTTVSNFSIDEKAGMVHDMIKDSSETADNFRVIITTQASLTIDLIKEVKRLEEENLHLRQILHQ